MSVRRLAVLTGALLAGCRPELGDAPSLIRERRVLAVRAEPAEARPGDAVRYDALVATPEGSMDDPPVRWAYCASPKALGENNVVSGDCLGEAGVRSMGGPAGAITGTTPLDACTLFGPDTPPGAFRPRDPDVTGGYYQPVRARVSGLTAFGLARISCNLAGAPLDIVKDFIARYQPNTNPVLGELGASLDGAPVALDALPRGEDIELSIGWSDGSREVYPVFDPAARELIERREALRTSWFATGGRFATGRTGGAEDDEPITNTWTTPAMPGAAWLWVVLRDERGGVDFSTYEVQVR